MGVTDPFLLEEMFLVGKKLEGKYLGRGLVLLAKAQHEVQHRMTKKSGKGLGFAHIGCPWVVQPHMGEKGPPQKLKGSFPYVAPIIERYN